MINPNPNRGKFTIDWGQSYEEVQLSIYDVSGKMIDARTVYAAEQVSLTINQGRGVYLVQIHTKEGLLETVKVVVSD
ncbi:MAG: T9SS type A sorting domain-containing protein [Aureispira sp.]